MSHSILRRYTPPTCTLEIVGESSSLSRWTRQPAIENLRFRLKLDDPRLSEEQKIEIEGDRPQLEALREAVETYVQEFLSQSPNRLNAALLTPSQTERQSQEQKAQIPKPSSFSERIYIQSKGLLSHELFVGAIAPNESENVIHLSSLQLFDLATAFDEYATDVVVLPDLNNKSDQPTIVLSHQNPRSPQFSNSFRIAASILIALGLTTYSIQKLGKFYETQQPTVATSNSETSSQPTPQIAIAPSPVLPPRQTTAKESISIAPNSANSSSIESQESPAPTASLPASRTAKPRVELPSQKLPSSLPTTIIQPTPNLDSNQITVLPEITNSDAKPSIIPPPPLEMREFPDVPLSPTPELEVIAPPPPNLSNDSLEQLSNLPDNSLGDRSSTAFDKIPQVAEIKEYFQQRWHPPDNLQKTIEYSLVLNPNGTIQQIIPLGPTAGTFLDRTPMPLLNESFVSPLESELQPTIRLVLDPDGNVQTFLQSVK